MWLHRISQGFSLAVRLLVHAMTVVASLGIAAMMGITCIDVLLRMFNRPLTGAYDLVQIAGAITIASALPYTTAVKGHVAIEYFFLKMGRAGRLVVDSLARSLSIALFVFLALESFQYGKALLRNGNVSSTLQIPLFWVPWVISFSCCVVALVIFHNLLHPGREMIKP